MKYESLDNHMDEYSRAASLVEENRHQEALEIFEGLSKKPLSPFDKSMLWINIAIIRDRMHLPEQSLLGYDEAIVHERSYDGYFAYENKAAYLAKIGRCQESIESYEHILGRKNLKPEDKERIEVNIKTLREHIGQSKA